MRALTVLLLCVAVAASAGKAADKDRAAKAAQIKEEIAKLEGKLDALRAELAGLDSDEHQAIASLIETYLKTPFDERGKYVLDRKEYEDGQAAYYKGRPLADKVAAKVMSVKDGPKEGHVTATLRITSTVEGKGSPKIETYYLAKSKAGYKLDWSANVGYSQTAFKTWAAGNDRTGTFRVQAELSNSYYAEYREGKAEYYSVSMTDQFGGRFAAFTGYVEKNSTAGKAIFQALKDGQKHDVIVTIEKTSEQPEIVGIKELVSSSWVK